MPSNYTPIQVYLITKTKRAFTLIELLVVVAVIGVLASILIPVVGGVRERGNLAQCTSNLRQLQTASMMYASEKGVYLPYTTNYDYDGDGKGDERVKWFENPDFHEYLGGDESRKDLVCPTRGDIYSTTAGGVGGRSYGMNGTGLSWSKVGENGVRTSKLERPSHKMAFADGADEFILKHKANAYVEERYEQHAIAYRHNGKANVVHYDGSVSLLSREEVVGNTALWDLDRR